jgi:hypothetical protein
MGKRPYNPTLLFPIAFILSPFTFILDPFTSYYRFLFMKLRGLLKPVGDL